MFGIEKYFYEKLIVGMLIGRIRMKCQHRSMYFYNAKIKNIKVTYMFEVTLS